MITCPDCGVARSYVGVIFPSRALCSCETATCEKCSEPAVMVEFQQRIKDQEPEDRQYLCKTHKPDDFVVELPTTKQKKKAAEKGRPNIDPAWSFETPPPGSTYARKIACAVCHDVHAMRDRKMWNGTESQCPKCQETVTVFAEED